MKRSDGEKIRAGAKIAHLRSVLHAVEIALRSDAPIGFDVPQHVTAAGADLALTLARCDAYQRAEAEEDE